MKYVICSLFCVCIARLAAAQAGPAVIFRAVNGPGKLVKVSKPLDGKVFIGFPEEDTLDVKGELIVASTDKHPGAYLFRYGNKDYRVWVKPGKQYVLSVDDNNPERPVVAQGPDREGVEALARLQFDLFQGRGMRYYREDTVFEHSRDRVKKEVDSCLQPFRQLLARKAIDKSFFQYAEHLVRNYYASVLATTLMMPVRALAFNKDSVRYDVAKIDRMDQYWQDVLALSDVRDLAATATDTYFNYWYVINSWYFDYFKRQSAGTYRPRPNDDAAQQAAYEAIDAHYRKEPMREFQVATLLRLLTLEKHYESIIPELFGSFAKRYPYSRYLPLLEPGVEEVRVFLATRKTEFTAGQRFVEEYAGIRTVDELAARFRGKVVFMDLWATWCGPCKQEFAYSKALKEVLTKNNIELLYVSIDKDAVDAQWKNMIKYYQLEGYHVRASKSLNDDIFRVFGKNEVLSIPRYVLFKDGKIVLMDARAPSSKEALYRQLMEALRS